MPNTLFIILTPINIFASLLSICFYWLLFYSENKTEKEINLLYKDVVNYKSSRYLFRKRFLLFSIYSGIFSFLIIMTVSFLMVAFIVTSYGSFNTVMALFIINLLIALGGFIGVSLVWFFQYYKKYKQYKNQIDKIFLEKGVRTSINAKFSNKSFTLPFKFRLSRVNKIAEKSKKINSEEKKLALKVDAFRLLSDIPIKIKLIDESTEIKVDGEIISLNDFSKEIVKYINILF